MLRVSTVEMAMIYGNIPMGSGPGSQARTNPFS